MHNEPWFEPNYISYSQYEIIEHENSQFKSDIEYLLTIIENIEYLSKDNKEITEYLKENLEELEKINKKMRWK